MKTVFDTTADRDRAGCDFSRRLTDDAALATRTRRGPHRLLRGADPVGYVPRAHLNVVDDGALVTAIGHGDEVAMAEIVKRHREPVLRFARRLVGGHALAEEVVQDVFLRLWERSEQFDPQRGALRAFLLALTHGRALDVVRSDAARRRREKRDVARSSQRGRS